MTEEQLEADLQSRFYELLDRTGVGIAQMDADGRYLLVNDRYCDLLGRTRDELSGKRIHDFLHPDDLAPSLDGFIRALETGEPALIEHRHVRRDGAAAWVSNNVSVGRPNGQGAPQYVMVLAHDISVRKQAERTLVRAQSDLRLLLDTAADGFCTVDRQGQTTLCNAAFVRMLGFEREEDVLGRDLHELLHAPVPPEQSHAAAECPVLRVARNGNHAHVADESFMRGDGKVLPVEYWVRPVVRGGQIRGAVCTFVDATERRQAEARQQLMNREMAHRVKNTLAMVQAIVGQTLRKSPDPKQAVDVINKRLAALGHAHTALTRTRWGNASIMEVIEGAIAVHASEARRIRLDGPKMDLGAKAVLTITMALHELCTNAAKYGALASEQGAVDIAWSVTGGAAGARFRLSWTETGGPPVSPPARKGFGSRLIAESVGADLRGEAKLAFEPGGVVWTLDAPLTAVAQAF